MDSHLKEPNKSSYVLQDDAGRKYVVSDNTNGDVTQYSGDEPYPEMTKEHLLRHSSKPLWKTLRTISIVIIILAWLSLIAATIAIIVIHPRCKNSPDMSWWKKSVVYRIYIRSFLDTDNNGVGDLNGVTSRLEYLKSLGVETISLSPFYPHEPQNEFSVLNHTMIDQDYGTMADFHMLVTELHKHDMRLVVDFIPGTTSSNHTWFSESASNGGRTNDYRNYYVWEAGTQEPTNWLTVYSGDTAKISAWTRTGARDQWYLHQFLSAQPALNLRNYRVQQELEDILKFWLDKGVDGFYVRNSAYLFVDYDLRDEEPMENPPTNNTNNYNHYKHDFTFGLPEINDMFARWRHIVNSHNSTRMLIADIRGSTEQTIAYYGRFGRDGVDISLNYDLLPVDLDCNGMCVKKQLDSWLMNIPSDKWQTWMVGTEYTSRVMSRSNSSLARALTMLTMFMPGTPVIYYGDEIGMSDVIHIPANDWSMDQPMRSPMQWTNSTNGGFGLNCTSNCQSPWIPVNPDYVTNNVMLQDLDEASDLAFFRTLAKVRQNPAVQYGDFRYVITNDNLVSFVREFDGQTNYLVAINFGSKKVSQDFRPSDSVTEAQVEAITRPTNSLTVGETADLSGIELGPHEGVVLSWDYQIKQY